MNYRGFSPYALAFTLSGTCFHAHRYVFMGGRGEDAGLPTVSPFRACIARLFSFADIMPKPPSCGWRTPLESALSSRVFLLACLRWVRSDADSQIDAAALPAVCSENLAGKVVAAPSNYFSADWTETRPRKTCTLLSLCIRQIGEFRTSDGCL